MKVAWLFSCVLLFAFLCAVILISLYLQQLCSISFLFSYDDCMYDFYYILSSISCWAKSASWADGSILLGHLTCRWYFRTCHDQIYNCIEGNWDIQGSPSFPGIVCLMYKCVLSIVSSSIIFSLITVQDCSFYLFFFSAIIVLSWENAGWNLYFVSFITDLPWIKFSFVQYSSL